MNADFSAVTNITVVGIPFLVMVLGLVEFTKKLGLSGRVLTVVSMVLGIVLGVAYQLSIVYPLFAPWFQIGFFGLAVGLAASGIYDFFNARFPASQSTPFKNPPVK